MDISALQVYRIGGKFYSILVKENGGPFVLGKQLVNEVPADPADFQGNYHRNPHSQQFPTDVEITSVEAFQATASPQGRYTTLHPADAE